MPGISGVDCCCADTVQAEAASAKLIAKVTVFIVVLSRIGMSVRGVYVGMEARHTSTGTAQPCDRPSGAA